MWQAGLMIQTATFRTVITKHRHCREPRPRCLQEARNPRHGRIPRCGHHMPAQLATGFAFRGSLPFPNSTIERARLKERILAYVAQGLIKGGPGQAYNRPRSICWTESQPPVHVQSLARASNRPPTCTFALRCECCLLGSLPRVRPCAVCKIKL